MKIVLLATDNITTWLVYNAISCRYNEIIVAIEKPVSKYQLLRNRVKKLGFLHVVGQVLFGFYSCYIARNELENIRNLLEKNCLNEKRPSELTAMSFRSVNSDECRKWLCDICPDVVVVNGTRIVSHETLSCCPAIFINTHCGITPAYRGVHGAYWALVNQDAKNAGVTVHLVDEGVDTGRVIYQDSIVFTKNDNFVTYPIKQYIAAIPLLLKSIEDIENFELKTTFRTDLPSKLWYHPTIWQYFYYRFTIGVS